MIFSSSTREIYWLLSTKMNIYDIFILNKIMNEKQRVEDIDNRNWYINEGIKLNKIRVTILSIERILFNPFNE